MKGPQTERQAFKVEGVQQDQQEVDIYGGGRMFTQLHVSVQERCWFTTVFFFHNFVQDGSH